MSRQIAGSVAAAGETTGDPGPQGFGGGTTDVIETTDAAGNTSTIYTLQVGQTGQGMLSPGGDHDFYAVNLTAGQTYTFAMVGTGVGNVQNTFLNLYGSNGTTVLTSDDNSLQSLNSVFTYTATTTGTHYLDAGSANNGTGQYGISVAQGTKATFDLAMGGGVIDTDFSWSPTPGTGINVTFGFRATAPPYIIPGHDTFQSTFAQFSADQMAAVVAVLQMMSDVCGLTFTHVNPGGHTDNASILFSNYFDPNDGAGGWGNYPGPIAGNERAGDVYIDTHSNPTTGITFGSGAFHLLLHEVGHALGLSHPGMYNVAPGLVITYADNAQFIQDTDQYTVMSYFDESNTGGVFGGWASTPMMFDIAALQSIYGVNTATRAGDTIYGFGSTAGAVYNFATNPSAAVCIWDGGGTDTINLSGFGVAQTINLNAGTFSSVGGLTNNLSIAIGVTIENATGGTAADTFHLTSANINNLINGLGGSDIVHVAYAYGIGYAVSGTGANLTLTGGSGVDNFQAVEFFVFSDGVQISSANLAAGVSPFSDLVTASATVTDTTPDVGQTIGVGYQIQNVGSSATGASFLAGVYISTDSTITTADTFLGSQSVAALAAGGSNSGTINVVFPGGLSAGVTYYIGVIADYTDVITSEASDTNNASAGVAVVTSPFTEGNDAITLPFANGTWHALGGNDTVTGTTGVDIVYGDAGDDVLLGSDGADQLIGGDGIDTVNYANSSAGVTVNLALKATAAQVSAGDASGDKLSLFEDMIGSAHADTITGSKTANVLTGLGGNDNIMGGNGNDVLSGGLGEDTLNGGKNDDILHGGDQNDTLIGDANNDQLFGDGDNDSLDGGKNNDMLDGGSGNDTLFGNSNDDILIGGIGNDTLTGGKNNDHFLFDIGFGQDVVTDFAISKKITDVIEFDSAVFASFNDILANSQQSGANVVITTTGGDTLTLQNVQLSALATGHFLIT